MVYGFEVVVDLESQSVVGRGGVIERCVSQAAVGSTQPSQHVVVIVPSPPFSSSSSTHPIVDLPPSQTIQHLYALAYHNIFTSPP